MKRFVASPFVLGGGIATIVLLGVGYLFFDVSRSDKDASSVVTVNVPASAPPQEEPETVNISNVHGDDPTIVEVVRRVSRHVLLPDGQVTVATVNNVENLRAENPDFYKFAQNGDKLLIYQDRMILYSPLLDRILDVIHDTIILPGEEKKTN